MDEVYVVNKTTDTDGLYVFAKREDAERFFEESGGDLRENTDAEVVFTTEPVMSGQHAADLIEAAAENNDAGRR